MSFLHYFSDVPIALTGTPPTAYYGVPYSWTPSRANGTAPFTYSIAAGSLPNGLSLNTTTGEISGTPIDFNPAQLFTGAEQGGWGDIQDLSSLWVDSAATTPASVGQPVGRVDDKSGNGNHITQSATANKPILRQDGSGYYYLEPDGVNDFLFKSFGIDPMLFPATRLTAISHIVTGTIIQDGGDAWLLFTNPELRMFNGTQLPGPTFNASTPYVITEKWDHPSASSIAKENDSYFTGTTGPSQGNGIAIGAGSTGVRPGATRIYGYLWIERALTAGEIANMRSYLALSQGRTL